MLKKLRPSVTRVVVGVFAVIGIAAANAQSLPSSADNPEPPSGGGLTRNDLSVSVELWVAGAVIAFGVFVIVIQYLLVRRKDEITAEELLRLFTVTLVVIGTLALIALGYSASQISPALGLFGSIIGYILGRSSAQADIHNRTSPPGGTSRDS